ncbi:hypothetical protein HZY83_05390 [Gemella sp. GH3]|uniref:hypothetical protein n=1 Tax=unclassified Gemella TaxID=2624949 RepID=UPI0015CFC6EE|nr:MULTISPECIES: hypothetical protein [unclassified Gemella]MBF0714105.1 hypothetical protein [Gemella sp. GH3.1]NYS51057.1 hypothetical protein [Gemella sp. GH3]
MEQFRKDLDKYTSALTEINEELQVEENLFEIASLVDEVEICANKILESINKNLKKGSE